MNNIDRTKNEIESDKQNPRGNENTRKMKYSKTENNPITTAD